jgi:hypothetical protein
MFFKKSVYPFVDLVQRKFKQSKYYFIYFFLLSDLELPTSAKETAKKNNFDLQGYQIKVAQKEQTRSPRLVRIGAIQNAIQKPTTASVQEQVR